MNVTIGRKNGSSSSRRQKRFDSVAEGEAALLEWTSEGFNVFWTAVGEAGLSKPFNLVDGERVYERMHLFTARSASRRLHRFPRKSLPFRSRKYLLQNRKRIAIRAVAEQRDEFGGIRRKRVAFLLRHCRSHFRKHGPRRLFEFKYLATRLHRFRHFLQLCCRQNKNSFLAASRNGSLNF